MNENIETLMRIYKNDRGKIYSFIKKKVACISDAEDIFHDVFMKTYIHYSNESEIKHDGCIYSFLYSSLRNKIIDYYRCNTVRKRNVIYYNELDVIDKKEKSVDYVDRVTPYETYNYNIIKDIVDKALDEVNPDFKDTYIKYYYEGKMFKDISKIKNKNINTILSHVHYIKKHFKKRLEENNIIIK